MDTNFLDHLERLFRAARLLAVEERSAFLDVVCAHDPKLRRELEDLLAADAEAEDDSFLSPSADLVYEAMEENAALSLDRQQIGPYKLLDLLGSGGMGEVWLAEQKEPIKRQVALKIIKLGMDTKEVIARFESERQALAVMEHPHIAKVFGGGTTETGRPYFVMELVRGIPINEYCDQHTLSTHERIELFLDVCRAVHHAHQKGIIHRDLKPSNVLVTMKDRQHVVKVIDFGIAKAVGQQLTDLTLATRIGQVIGTPAYMSPEQAAMGGLDVDTRTDVYSLGVMLYELLVGTKPVDFSTSSDQSIHARIRDTNVPKPSTRLTGLDQKNTIAAQRQTTPDQLRRELQGDLDWIVLKAMEKDRLRRYETVHSVVLELQRYLNNEPVLVRPPSMGYRLQKFVRRHRTSVIAASLVLLALLAGTVAATVGLLRAQEAEQVAQEEAITAQRVSDFLIGLFEVADPSQNDGVNLTARELLNQGATRIRTELADEPIIRAQMLHTIGRAYSELGLEAEADSMLSEAIALREQELGPDHLDVAASLRVLAQVRIGQYGGISNERREGILSLLERARAIHEEQLGPDHPEVAQDWFDIGYASLVLRSSADTSPSRVPDALAAYEKALALWENAYGPNDARLAPVLYRLGRMYRRDSVELAAQMYERGAEVLAAEHGPESGLLLEPLYGLYFISPSLYKETPEEGEAIFQRIWSISDEALLKEDVNLGLFINIGNHRRFDGYYEDSEAAYRRAYRLGEQKLGPDTPLLPIAMRSLADLYILQNRWEDARAAAEEALLLWERLDEQTDVATAKYIIALYHAQKEEYGEAEDWLRQALDIYEEYSQWYDMPTASWDLAILLHAQGRHAEARRIEQAQIARYRERTQADRTRDADWRFYGLALVGCYSQWKFGIEPVRCEAPVHDAEAALEAAQKGVELAPNRPRTVAALAIVQYFNNDREAAIATMNRALDLFEANDPVKETYEDWLDRFRE